MQRKKEKSEKTLLKIKSIIKNIKNSIRYLKDKAEEIFQNVEQKRERFNRSLWENQRDSI